MSYQQLADRRRNLRSTVEAKQTDDEKKRKQQQERLDATRRTRNYTDGKSVTDIVYEYTPSDNLYEIRDVARIEKTESYNQWDHMDGLVFKSRNQGSDIVRKGKISFT